MLEPQWIELNLNLSNACANGNKRFWRTHKKALTPSCRSLHYNQAFWNAVHSSAIVSAWNVKSFSHFDWGYVCGMGGVWAGSDLNEIWIRWARSLGDFFTTNPRLMMMSAYEMAFALFRIASQCGLWLWILRLKKSLFIQCIKLIHPTIAIRNIIHLSQQWKPSKLRLIEPVIMSFMPRTSRERNGAGHKICNTHRRMIGYMNLCCNLQSASDACHIFISQ